MAGSPAPKVGVLALQGDVREHLTVLRALGADAVPVRREAELRSVDGLVIPGGESSVIDKLSRMFGVAEPLKARIAEGMPVYGTCAGLIMIADTLLDAIGGQQSLGGLDVDIPELGEPPVHAVFIRAPVVESVGDRASVLAALPDGRIVAVEQGNLLGTSFHPEVTGEHRFHERFLERVRAVA